ncbi:MAG: tRNA 2-thiocytidine biosynthesis TtcA family protein [Erysipelotrichaceae bacterium]
MVNKKILGAIIQADKDFNLIQENDKIAVGVSGGKDSVVLLYFMHLYQMVAKKMFNKQFEVIGVHIDLNFGGMDFSELDLYCAQHNITLVHEKSKVYDILKLHPKNDRIQCSLCSKLKKGAVIKKAKELGCNKIAFGHHIDDALETLLMNMIHGGKIATYDPKMYLSDSDTTFIRPFSYVHENQIIQASEQLKLPVVKSTCPNDGFTHRQLSKELLEEIYEQFPAARNNFKRMLTNTEQLSLWEIEKKG